MATYATNDTNLVIDTNGYFAPPGSGGLSFYPLTPCRVIDTRSNNGQPFTGELTVPVQTSPCGPPATAEGYVFNATVVPDGHAELSDAVAGSAVAADSIDAERD